MELTLPELIDRITILHIKIEKLGETYIKEELNVCEEALKKFRKKNKIRQEWFERLKKINSEIWGLEFDVREIMDAEDVWRAAEEKFGFEELGRRAKEIARLVIERANIKNEIAEETGEGFKEVKTGYCGQR